MALYVKRKTIDKSNLRFLEEFLAIFLAYINIKLYFYLHDQILFNKFFFKKRKY